MLGRKEQPALRAERQETNTAWSVSVASITARASAANSRSSYPLGGRSDDRCRGRRR